MNTQKSLPICGVDPRALASVVALKKFLDNFEHMKKVLLQLEQSIKN